MKVLIENYRGFEITFDTETNQFLAYSNEKDVEQEKRSYPATKKWIDDYVKENANFKRVLVCPVLGSYRMGEGKFTLTGIRKDSAFMAENAKGTFQVSKYDEEKYCIWDKSHDDIKDKYDNYNKQIDELKKSRDQYLKDNYKPITLDMYRDKLLTNPLNA